ncbi:MAG: hypothetical protein ACOCTI_05500 [Phycisphaeraceae bacterium]
MAEKEEEFKQDPKSPREVSKPTGPPEPKKANAPAAPKDPTDPAPKKNDPWSEGPPRGKGDH